MRTKKFGTVLVFSLLYAAKPKKVESFTWGGKIKLYFYSIDFKPLICYYIGENSVNRLFDSFSETKTEKIRLIINVYFMQRS